MLPACVFSSRNESQNVVSFIGLFCKRDQHFEVNHHSYKLPACAFSSTCCQHVPSCLLTSIDVHRKFACQNFAKKLRCESFIYFRKSCGSMCIHLHSSPSRSLISTDMKRILALLSVFRALLSVCRALLSVFRALLNAFRALLSVFRALLSVGSAILSVYEALLSVRRALLGVHRALSGVSIFPLISTDMNGILVGIHINSVFERNIYIGIHFC